MTRESLIRTTLDTQLRSFTGWRSVTANNAGELSLSDMPGFSIALGDTRFDSYDSLGNPATGEQTITIKFFFSHYQNAATLALAFRSDYLSLIETFFSGVYIAPAVSVGDTVRIDAMLLSGVDEPFVSQSATRGTITIHVRCLFTVL